ncbi:hypothetical protein F511_06707 [Dorcoceras hygrometricum]|uniref:ICln family transporter: chloride ion current inducer protein I(Cln) n=1 Tax=Dorcoceras hygrometricum TaxID=472368 RepID=A0A2Z7B5S4_9LAMI|nr:hypothetical protein F511_06707 [Dorcoceras hygrometricum]
MAASFYSNSVHVDFDSVLAMDEPGMVSMFQALVASGLQGFLGCSAVVYEEALVEFFANGRVRDGSVVSSVNGVIIEISEELFAETFELPVDGLGDLSEMPKDAIFDARSIVSLSDKGKDVLVEQDPVKGNPAKEHYSLICADIELLVNLRAQVIDEVAKFFHSFSLKKLASINFEEMYKNEEQVLYWGETESPQIAIQRKFYILLKYRTVLVWKFLEAWRANFAPGQGSSAVDLQVIELLSDLHLSFLEELAKEARAHGLTWTKPCCSKIFEGSPRDRGAIIARNNTHTPSRSLQLAEPVSNIASIRSPIVALRVSQFCSVFVDLSLFNWFPSTDISEFLSSIALDRIVLRNVQSSQNSFSVASSTDIDATATSLPPVSQDLSAALADLQANLSEQIFEYQSDFSSKLHKIEQSVCDSLRDQADIFRNLSQGARQEVRTLDDVQTIRFNDFRKNVLAQNASIFTGLADVRQEVQAVNAKVDMMASRLNAIQKDAEATKEALSHQLFEFQSSAQENHSVLHAQLSELVDYIHRGRADKKGESGSRGLQHPATTQIEGSAERPTFEAHCSNSARC